MNTDKISTNEINLRQLPLFISLSDEEYNKIKDKLYIKSYSKGEIIFKSNDPANKMYLIISGVIKISKIMSDAKEQILYIYNKNDFVGGHNILSHDKYEYNAQALKKTTVLTVSSDIVNNVLKHNNNFLLTLLSQSFERIRKAEDLIDRLSIINTEVKVAKLLKNLAKQYGKKTKNGIITKFNITQEELGSLAGISRETMSRKLNQFEEDGILEIVSRGKILIYDLAKLDEILDDY